MRQDYFNYPLMKIGIIGGGQLGKMMTQAAKKMGFYVIILDPTPNSPAAQIADKQIIGDFYDEEKLREIVLESDVTTYDIEHVNVSILNQFEDKGYKIHPSPKILEIIQDKSKQKELLIKAGLPVPNYQEVESLDVLPSILENFSFPVVQKARRGGYDGRGVFIIKNKNDIAQAIPGESFLEEFVDVDKELAVNVARNTLGEIKCFPVVEMVFIEKANICDMVIAPARIEVEIEGEAKQIAFKTIEALSQVGGAIGIFGIEMFLTKNGKILINEIAPRPHNSGHLTIEACVTSQFEQHIRAITGLPLGSTDLLSPAVMINLLGEEGEKGPAIIEGLNKALSIPGLSFHFYGKEITRPFRKMGHVTIVDKDIERAIEKARKVKEFLKVKAKV